MTNNENSNRDPRKRLYRALSNRGWTEHSDGTWRQYDRKIYIDSIGIFLYYFTMDGGWNRKFGVSHNLIKTAHLEDGYILSSDGRKIYL